MIGQTISHYEIVDKIGEGGMGEVYRARDSSLDREVALKVLPPEVAADPERLERFQREAKALAALDHSNIVTVFSVEKADLRDPSAASQGSSGEARRIHFLTMAYVEGKTLAQLIPPGGLPLHRLLRLAVQLADALRAAHDKGIVHRDLKPANVMVDAEDRLRVLDFGLAKLRAETGSADLGQLATEAMTQEGAVLGTYPYMSPEQLEGKPADERSDIFSLGVILHEMARGKRPFQGDSGPALISSILKDTPPPVNETRPELPRHLGRIVSRCLEKDPRRRAQSALDLHNELRTLREEVTSGSSVVVAPARAATPWAKWGLAVAAVVAALLAVWTLLERVPAPSSVEVGPTTIKPLTNFIGWEAWPSWSPDGSMIAYSHIVGGDADLAVLSRGGSEPHILTGDSPADELHAAWSPDGSKIAYVSDRGSGTDIYWIPPTGGPERKLAETHIPFLERMGAWAWCTGTNPWSPDSEELLFSRLHKTGDAALWKVSLTTGEQTQLTFPPPGAEDLGGAWSFDGKSIVFTRHTAGLHALWLLPAAGGEASLLLADQPMYGMPAWFPDSRRLALMSIKGGAPNLWELTLDTGELRQLTFGGGVDMFPVVSRDGSIAYTQFGHQVDLYWIPLDAPDREQERLTTYTGENFGARISRDRNLISYYSNRTGNFDLWLLDRATGQHRPLTDHPASDRLSDWSPDGEEIVFMSDRDGAVRLWVVRVDTGAVRRLTDHEIPWSSHTAEGQGGPRWAPDGSVIGYLAPEEGSAIWLIDPDGSNRRPSTVRGALSFGWYRDGHRVVYTRRAPGGVGGVELRAAHLETGEDVLLWVGAIAEVAVAADGSALSFIEAVSHFTMELYMLRLTPPTALSGLPTADGEPEQLTFGEGQWHVHSGGWAPDGSGVVYSRDRDFGDIYVIESGD